MSIPALILSDLHLGAPNSALNAAHSWNPSEVTRCIHGREARDKLLAELGSLSEGQTVERLVLLGDVIDLSHGEFRVTLGELGTLLEEIWNVIEIQEVVFLPGNHDRHWWTLQCEHLALTQPLLTGGDPETFYSRTTDPGGRTTDLDVIATPLRVAVNDLPLRVAYPDFEFVVNRMSVRLHHGHLIEPLWTLLYRILKGLKRDLVDAPLARERDPVPDPTPRQMRILGKAAEHLGEALESTLASGGAPARELVDRLSGPFADLDWLFAGQNGLLARFGASQGLARAVMRVFEDPELEDRDKEDVLNGLTELIGLEIQDAFSPKKDQTDVPVPHSFSSNVLKTGFFRELSESIGRALVSGARDPAEGAARISRIQEDLPEIHRYLRYYGTPDPDVFVFGHTHRAGSHEPPGQPQIFNTGGWVSSGKTGIPESSIVRITEAGQGELHLVDLQP